MRCISQVIFSPDWGLWEDSIASNIAARDAARRLGDIGEELHAMDYLVYAYLQTGRDLDDTWWSAISGPTLPSSFLRQKLPLTSPPLRSGRAGPRVRPER